MLIYQQLKRMRMANKEQSIPDQLKIYQYKSYNDIPHAKLAWITIKAKQQGKDPKMVHAGIKARMARSTYKPTRTKATKKKIAKAKASKKVGKKKSTKKKSNMYALSIKQWNPFVGCEFDCSYCESSFQRQAKRQKQRCLKCYKYTPHTHPDRLTDYIPKTKENEFIFACASGDISFCPTPFLNKIIKRIEKDKNKTFLIQSKNPKTFQRVIFPQNTILGTTIETNRDKLYDGISKAPKPSKRYKDFLKIEHPSKMITIEPVVDFDLGVMVKWVKDIKPCMVWLGYDSKKNDLPEPSYEKFMNLKKTMEQVGIKVILKTVREKRI